MIFCLFHLHCYKLDIDFQQKSGYFYMILTKFEKKITSQNKESGLVGTVGWSAFFLSP